VYWLYLEVAKKVLLKQLITFKGIIPDVFIVTTPAMKIFFGGGTYAV